MTTGEMAAWTRRLKDILEGPADVRQERLERMLEDLQKTYGIELQKNCTVMRGWFEQRLAMTVQEWMGAI